MSWMSRIPGDPAGVKDAAARYLSTADSIDEAARELLRVANEIRTISLAVDQVRSQSAELAGVIERAETRYRGTGDALHTYAVALQEAQRKHESAMASARSGSSDLDNASYYRDYYRELAETPGPEQLDMIEKYRHWREKAENAQHDVDVAHQQAAAAYEERDSAALVAMSSIVTAMEASGLNDTLWDHLAAVWDGIVEFWVTVVIPALEAIVAFIDEYGWILDVLATIFTIAAVFFPALAVVAAALRLISLAVNALAFVATLALTLSGRKSLGDLIGASIGLALAFTGTIGKGAFANGLRNVTADFRFVTSPASWSTLAQPQLAFRTVFQLEGLHAASELASSGARNVLTHDTMQAIIDSAGREALADGLKDAAGGIVHDYVVTKAIENVSSGWTDMIVGVFENV